MGLGGRSPGSHFRGWYFFSLRGQDNHNILTKIIDKVEDAYFTDHDILDTVRSHDPMAINYE
jgi:hypothetical protein